jgi:predicted DNA-binding transcriptional regulator YafY
MRADRLVSILMLLQSRGRVPARELAEMLGVSVRTIFRDMDALSTAGIPVYAERGPAGGCRLVEDYRTDLTGLNAEEARSLFLLTALGPLDSLEVGQKLKSALRKLAAALPDYLESTGSRPRIYLDWTGWGRHPAAGEQLGVLYRAVQRQEQVRLAYRLWMGREVEQKACPLGLAAKTGEWYAAYQVSGKVRWSRVSDLLRVELFGGTFDYPPGFNLETSWRAFCADWEAGQTGYAVCARATGWALGELRRRQGVTVQPLDREPAAKDWAEVDLAFSSYEAARQNLMGLGRGIEVLDPEVLRLGMIDYARQILLLYTK